MCMEFWVGWFDFWGCKEHNRRSHKEIAEDLDEILSQGSVNIYMFHGGTSFGFTNGANYYDRLTPDVSSYDYDAPLTEDGRITPKYSSIQTVISKYSPIPKVTLTTQIKRISYGSLEMNGSVDLFSVLQDISTPVESLLPIPMEKMPQSFGYILYRSAINTGNEIEKFRLMEANDRAQVFLDRNPVLTLYDQELMKEHSVNWRHPRGASLDILVENMGRVNYGPCMSRQGKGIVGSVIINSHSHSGWMQYSLPLREEDINRLNFSKAFREGLPAFYRFQLDAEKTGDTFLDMTGWGKGCAFLNGFNLGRFWEIGPQKRLYIPAPLLKRGINEIVIFETEGKYCRTIELCDEHDLG